MGLKVALCNSSDSHVAVQAAPAMQQANSVEFFSCISLLWLFDLALQLVCEASRQPGNSIGSLSLGNISFATLR